MKMTFKEKIDDWLHKKNLYKKTDFRLWLYEVTEKVGLPVNLPVMKKLRVIYKRIHKKNYDGFGIIAGYEGTGKSTLAGHFATVISPDSFNINTYCFNVLSFLKAARSSTIGMSIIPDEGVVIAGSRGAMTKENKMVQRAVNIVRGKNLNFMVCIPRYWELDKIMTDRAAYIVVIPNPNDRGRWLFFDKHAKIKADEIMRKNKSYKGIHKIKGMVRGRSCKKVAEINGFTWEEYEAFKEQNSNEILEEDIKRLEPSIKPEEENKKLINSFDLRKKYGRIGTMALKRMIQKGELEGKKIGGAWYVTRESAENHFKV